MINVISSEIYKISKSKAFYGVFIVFLMMNAMAIFSIFKEKLTSNFSEVLITGISAYQVSYQADGIIYIILIFTAFLITSEYSNGSIRQMASHGIERWKLVIGKYIAISLITIITVLGFGFINLLSFTVAYELGKIDITAFIRMNLGMICMIFASVGLCTFLSYLLKNVGITIIVSVIATKGSDLIVKLFQLVTQHNEVEMYSLTNMRKIIINFNSSSDDVIKCSFILLLISITTIIGSCLLFSKRDID